MKPEQFVSVIIAGALTIALIMAAGLYAESGLLIRMAILGAACMYLTQAADAVRSEYLRGAASKVVDFLIVGFWFLAVVFSAIGIVGALIVV